MPVENVEAVARLSLLEQAAVNVRLTNEICALLKCDTGVALNILKASRYGTNGYDLHDVARNIVTYRSTGTLAGGVPPHLAALRRSLEILRGYGTTGEQQ